MLEFLKYVEKSTDEVASASKSQLVKAINEKVKHLKEDKSMEVEYMTLLERDREKFQEGIEQGIAEANKQMGKKLLHKGLSIEEVVALTELSKEEIEAIRDNM